MCTDDTTIDGLVRDVVPATGSAGGNCCVDGATLDERSCVYSAVGIKGVVVPAVGSTVACSTLLTLAAAAAPLGLVLPAAGGVSSRAAGMDVVWDRGALEISLSPSPLRLSMLFVV